MDITSQLRTTILSQSLPPPSQSFLTQLATARSPPPPTPSLVATARARILACDLTSSPQLLDTTSLSSFPQDIADVTKKESKLANDIHVQVLDVENISIPRWEQVEELEAIERGEMTRGREIIRVTAEDDDNEPQTQTQGATQQRSNQNQSQRSAGKNATHKVTLQDYIGKRVYGLELKRIDKIGVSTTNVGEKWVLKRGAVVNRGVIMLTPESCVVLGGKVDAWHRTWLEGRLARLKEAVGSDRPSGI